MADFSTIKFDPLKSGAPAASLSQADFATRAGVPISETTVNPDASIGGFIVGKSPITNTNATGLAVNGLTSSINGVPTGLPEGTGSSTPQTGGADWNAYKTGQGFATPNGFWEPAVGTNVDGKGVYQGSGMFYDPATGQLTGGTAPAGGGAPTTPTAPTAPVFGQYTPEQQAQIDRAGANAGGQYDTLITKAGNDKTAGMGKAVVAAGERGGFMNTQFAGQAALQSTNGGNFVGNGGELNRIKSEYDLNIQDLQSRKLTAIEAAKQAMAQYIDTGKQTAFANARALYQDAVAASEKQQELAAAKAKAISDAQKASFDMSVPLSKAGADIQKWALDNLTKYPDVIDTYVSSGGKASDLQNLNANQLAVLISNSPSFKAKQAKDANSGLPASAQEYQYAVSQGYEGSFTQYQNEDANRKRAVSNTYITGGNGLPGLTGTQATLFNGIVNKYNTSPLVLASDRTAVLKGIIAKINENPSDAASQLSLAYGFVQALDTYQSAVREGELNLVGSIDSKVGQLSNEVQKMTNGQLVRPDVAKQIASAAQALVDTIDNAAKAKATSYKSQAATLGLGAYWDQYISGFQPGYSSGGAGDTIPKGTDGSSYGHPGYESDGTQWVLKK